MKVKLVIALILIVFICAGFTQGMVYRDIVIIADGKIVKMENEPFIINGITYVPIREYAENLGQEVAWEDDTSTVIIGERLTDGEKLEILDTMITGIIEIVLPKQMVNSEIIWRIHNYLILTTEYDYGYLADGYTAYGAIAKHKATCQGYSFAFKMIMDRMGIGCKSVIGNVGGVSHIWNYVEFSDGWYFIDLTLNDYGDGKVGYEYYKKTEEEISGTHTIFFILRERKEK